MCGSGANLDCEGASPVIRAADGSLGVSSECIHRAVPVVLGLALDLVSNFSLPPLPPRRTRRCQFKALRCAVF